MTALRLLGIIVVAQGLINCLTYSALIGRLENDALLLFRGGAIVLIKVCLLFLDGLIPSIGLALALRFGLVRTGWRGSAGAWVGCGLLLGASVWSLLGGGSFGIAFEPTVPTSIVVAKVVTGAISGGLAGACIWRRQRPRAAGQVA